MSSRTISLTFLRNLKPSFNHRWAKAQNVPNTALARRHASGMDSITVRKGFVVARRKANVWLLLHVLNVLHFILFGVNSPLFLYVIILYLFKLIIVPSVISIPRVLIFFPIPAHIKYSGGQATVGQGGFYGSGNWLRFFFEQLYLFSLCLFTVMSFSLLILCAFFLLLLKWTIRWCKSVPSPRIGA